MKWSGGVESAEELEPAAIAYCQCMSGVVVGMSEQKREAGRLWLSGHVSKNRNERYLQGDFLRDWSNFEIERDCAKEGENLSVGRKLIYEAAKSME